MITYLFVVLQKVVVINQCLVDGIFIALLRMRLLVHFHTRTCVLVLGASTATPIAFLQRMLQLSLLSEQVLLRVVLVALLRVPFVGVRRMRPLRVLPGLFTMVLHFVMMMMVLFGLRAVVIKGLVVWIFDVAVIIWPDDKEIWVCQCKVTYRLRVYCIVRCYIMKQSLTLLSYILNTSSWRMY